MALRHECLLSPEFKEKNKEIKLLGYSGNEPALNIEFDCNLQALFDHVRQTWEHLGSTEPHWSVLSAEAFRGERLKANMDAFKAAGQTDTQVLLNSLHRHAVALDDLKDCLEFGCGVGRVTFWLAKHFQKVTGVDISQPHLDLAASTLQKNDIKNVTLKRILAPEDLSELPNVDLVYSIIVLQHNPPPLMRFMLDKLFHIIRPKGIAFIQIPTYREGYSFSLREYQSAQGRSLEMEMHVLPQQEVFVAVEAANMRVLEVIEDTWTGGGLIDRSNTFILQKR